MLFWLVVLDIGRHLRAKAHVVLLTESLRANAGDGGAS